MPNPKPPNPSRPPVGRGERPPRIQFPTRVRRLRLRYSNNEWETVANIILDRKTLRHSAELPSGTRSGFWYELRDRSGKLLYRGKSANPFEPSLELFEPDGSIRRVPLKRKEVYVELLIPDLPESERLSIFSNITPEGEVCREAEVIRTVTLRDDNCDDDDQQEEHYGR
ncbi:MAG: hypothetical protein QNJ51_12740 [Calothrix sp. MO_167.B12]|nr:hypothetical protein [Calothrix sp. MO_167.B12]